jgi:histidine triad (HIT) family protein|tara:strand:+ start:280 stop:717 length:438 start_codon:yes stop_codon:yes gene_type:complete
LTEIQCKFCKIIEKKEKAVILFENKKIIAILDNKPFNRGHTLILPKTHYKFITDMPDREVGYIFKNVNRIAKAIFSSVKADGLNIGQNNGEIASQTIFHVHIHIIPRFKKDAINNKFPTRKSFTIKELKETRKCIQEVLNASTFE